MLTALTELCQELRNWFDRDRRSGTFEITGGSFTADFLQDGQYYRIIGSVFNDGIHKYGHEEEGELEDETFKGSVWALGIPKAVVDLATEIAAWRTKYENVNSPSMSPYTSENFFGDYSYSKASSGTNGNSVQNWRSVFSGRLNQWRKIL